MVDPLNALLIAAVGVGILVLMFWHEVGIFARWQRSRQNSRKVLFEDALKHFYDYEYKGLLATPLSLSGALEITHNDGVTLLGKLESSGFIRPVGEGYGLTPEGRAYALHIIRSHRLWERFLADETSFTEKDWHKQAEKQEHRISKEDADALAERMGHPRFDPHGDPIPTATGDLPARKGTPLTQLQEDDWAEIIHLEDEPREIFDRIADMDLFPGMRLRILNTTSDGVVFESEGVHRNIEAAVAANVTVKLLPADFDAGKATEPLSGLSVGEEGIVVSISRACRGMQRRRLLDLGVVPGTVITTEFRSAGGDPTAYTIRGAMIALRKKQADLIQVNRLEEERG